MVNFNDIDKKEWRNLGFFYTFNVEKNRWEFYGDRLGLQNFSKALNKYVSDSKNVEISEHIHLGPHSYLKIITWEKPVINEDGFYGSITDLEKLISIYSQKLSSTKEDDCFTIDKEYSSFNKSSLYVCVKKEGFDPSSLDDVISK